MAPRGRIHLNKHNRKNKFSTKCFDPYLKSCAFPTAYQLVIQLLTFRLNFDVATPTREDN
jgi:hypothetical protein